MVVDAAVEEEEDDEEDDVVVEVTVEEPAACQYNLIKSKREGKHT